MWIKKGVSSHNYTYMSCVNLTRRSRWIYSIFAALPWTIDVVVDKCANSGTTELSIN